MAIGALVGRYLLPKKCVAIKLRVKNVAKTMKRRNPISRSGPLRRPSAVIVVGGENGNHLGPHRPFREIIQVNSGNIPIALIDRPQTPRARQMPGFNS